jgi:hypothetical protein
VNESAVLQLDEARAGDKKPVRKQTKSVSSCTRTGSFSRTDLNLRSERNSVAL